MLTQETAARVWQTYREIETAKKLLSDMQEIREREYQRTLTRPAKHEPTLTDAFGRKQHLQLGIPTGENGHRLLQVAPELGESVIRAHIAKMEAELTEANEQARLENSEAQPLEVDRLVDKFLSWPLPETVCTDLCATRHGDPHRCGTNLLTAAEAKQMLEYLLKG
jgi:hypothetical protein